MKVQDVRLRGRRNEWRTTFDVREGGQSPSRRPGFYSGEEGGPNYARGLIYALCNVQLQSQAQNAFVRERTRAFNFAAVQVVAATCISSVSTSRVLQISRAVTSRLPQAQSPTKVR
jgi:hypothetical protein